MFVDVAVLLQLPRLSQFARAQFALHPACSPRVCFMLRVEVFCEVDQFSRCFKARTVVDTYVPRAVVANGDDRTGQLGASAASCLSKKPSSNRGARVVDLHCTEL